MKRRVLTVLMLVLVGGLLVVPTVAAEAPTTPPRLVADGDGLALLFGKGVIDLTGNGILWIKANEGATVEVTGYGHKEVFDDGWQQYAGFDGTAHIEARRMRVILAGTNIHLEATGRGKAFLWGHGTLQHANETARWSTNALGRGVALSEAPSP